MTTTVNGLAELTTLAGTDLGQTDWLSVSQERIDMFADATDDHQWIHVDAERAKSGPFGGTIAHGFLTLSLVIPLFTQLLRVEGVSMAVNYGLNRVRFPSPVRSGSKIRARGRLVSVEEVKGGVQAIVELTVETDGGTKPACVAELISRFYG